MNRIGIVMNSMFSSQNSYFIIRNVNNYLVKNYNTDFILFVKELTLPCIEPECGVMRWEELWGYDGHLITTDLEATKKAIVTPGPNTIYFYMNDLEWTRKNRVSSKYEELASVYQNPQVKLIAKNEEYKKLTENIWNVDVYGVCHNFDVPKMLEIVGVKNE